MATGGCVMTLWDRYQLAVTLLAMWASLALAATGEVPVNIMIPSLAVPPLAFLARRYLRKVPWWIWDLLVFALFLQLIPVARQNLLNATIYFLLALQAVKLLSFRRVSDAYSSYVVSFFQMFAAALLTTSPTYGLAVVGYLVLLVRCFLFHNELASIVKVHAKREPKQRFRVWGPTRDEREIVTLYEQANGSPAGQRLGTTLALALLLLSLSIIFFLIVPRLSTRRVFQTLGPPPSQISSAFDENIELGKFGTIQLDTSVAMYVKPLDTAGHPTSIRLRGVALDTFDGSRWERTSWAAYREAFGQFCLRPYPLRANLIIQPANTSRFLFGETFPFALQSFDFQQALLSDPSAGVAWLPYPPSKELHYTVISRVEELDDRQDPALYQRPSAKRQTEAELQEDLATSNTSPIEMAMQRLRREFGLESGVSRPAPSSDTPHRRGHAFAGDMAIMRNAPDYIFPPYLAACLRIPEDVINVSKLRKLAEEITRGASSRYVQAVAIERYLRQNYQYSLELPNPGAENAIEHFLYTSRSGHCEYFATAMAMLLRSLRIPCRVVNGYYSSEWNNVAGMFTVRQRDAHSWVEVYFDGYGWMTFDPTPPSALQRPSPMNPLFMAVTRYYDALKLRWYRSVIDFSVQDQRYVVHGVLAAFFAIGDALGSLRFENLSNSLSDDLPSAGEILLVVASVALVAGMLALAFRHLRLRSSVRKRRSNRRSYHMLPRFYRELLEALRKRGFVKEPHETPLEFAKRVARDAQLPPVEFITLCYYGVRYGGAELSREELEQIEQFSKEFGR